ncbi:nucleotide-binding alpha-beta plait domain-containing protein, partial [Tanacetum coccineum]
MIEPFLITNNLMGYVDGSISCPSKTLSVTDGATGPKENPNYLIWISDDAHVRTLIISIISKASFHHVQGITFRDLWLSLKKAYAPHFTSREYILKTHLLRIKMHGDETPNAYLNHAQDYADALTTIGEPVKDKDLVILVISGLREEYNGLKTMITARQSPTAISELHALLSDHDYMLKKLVHPLHHMVHKPFMVLAHQTTTGVTITTTVAIATTLVVTTTEVVIMVVNLIGHPPKIQCMALAIDVVLVTLLTGPIKHGLYTITLPQLKSINKVSFSAVRASPTIWHRR